MSADVSMANEPEVKVIDKISILSGASADGSAATFEIKHEGHTLGNALRYMIMKNPDVELCGYSIPHPSEDHMHLRIQTYGDSTAIEALRKGLADLVALCDHVEGVFREKVTAGDYADTAP